MQKCRPKCSLPPFLTVCKDNSGKTKDAFACFDVYVITRLYEEMDVGEIRSTVAARER